MSCRPRNKFVRAVSITTGVMTSMYLLVGVTGYTVFGSDIDLHKPITSLLPQDGWSVFMNAGLFAHCIIAYQININVWSSLLLHVLSPKLAQAMAGHHDEHDGEQHSDGGAVEGAGTGDDVPEEQQRLLSPPPPGGGGATAAVAVAPVPAVLSPLSKRLVWLAVTSLCIAYSGLTSYTFPFFSIVMAIIASLGDFASMVGLPGLFCVKLLKLPAWEVALCWSMLVLSVGLSGVGIYSSVQQLVAAMAGGGGSGGV